MINSLKDNFGFIERADVVREIFFHVSEMNGGDSVTPHLGDDVEFTIQVGYLFYILKSEITNRRITLQAVSSSRSLGFVRRCATRCAAL